MRLVLLAAVALLAGSSHATTCKVHVVTHARVAYAHFRTIQAAVDASRSCDWVLVAPGVYPERVVIRTPGLRLRGFNRNTVIVDGRHRVGDGILVDKASDVTIENLTVRNFDRSSRDAEDGGNEIWWNGGDGSGKIGLHGWSGSYLTTFSTGLLAGYGIFISNSVNGSLSRT